MSYRIEKDSLGEVKVPSSAYYGAQTQRAVDNFPISGKRFPRRFIRAIGIVKKACCHANEDLGRLDVARAEWIAMAAQEVADGQHDEHFPIDIFQTGSGTSTNMNANEVISNRAIELMGGELGSKDPVHPNDHVNMGQSSNDVIPTTIHVAGATAIHEELLPALRHLHAALDDKAKAWDHIVKSGRTHLMDATPIRLGQEFSGYAAQLAHAVRRAEAARDALLELALGGTAVGTGINRPKDFPRMAIARISDETGLSFVEAANHFEAQGARDGVVEAHGQLKTIAASLTKIANDVRWLGSGPRTGFYELALPETQPGSSIMPGKVNPVMSEMLTMVCAQVMGNDVTVNVGGMSGNFELNVFLPVMAMNLLESVHILANGCRTFADRCIIGAVANEENCQATVERNLAICTSLAPAIGYDKAAAISKHAFKTGGTVRAVAKEWGVLPDEEIDRLLDFHAMTVPEDA
ncbi:MAG: class II fumarate hydratase [Alphaproteobacteria bacterium]|nr:class II fumarate hydratase [Alphaproteobacteria bacterium]MCB9792170.1 class II fumarate hydratase [Alphaproteobacteria bacterium]